MRRSALLRFEAILALVLASLSAGCSEPGDPRSEPMLRVDTLESGTVRVVNGEDAGWAPGEGWALEEDLRLGTLDGTGPEAFSRIADILVDDEGRIHVLDYPTQEIRVFSASGEFLRTIGGEGQGPGELTGVTKLSRAPDGRLWARSAYQYVVLEPTGEEIARHPRAVWGVVESWRPGFDDGGRYIDWGLDLEMVGTAPTGDPIFSGRHTFHPIAFRPPDQLDSLPPFGLRADVMESGMLKLNRQTMRAALDGGDVWFARSDEYRVYRRTLEGDTLLEFSLPATPRLYPEAEMEARIAESVEHGYGHRTLTRADFVPELPVVTQVLTDGAGHVYVFPQEAGVAEGGAVDVFRESGRYLGRLDLASPVTSTRPVPLVIEDHLYAMEPSDMEVPFVVRYRIVRPGW